MKSTLLVLLLVLLPGILLLESCGKDEELALDNQIPTVEAKVETEPVPSAGDAADDVAIWIHPLNPELSAIVATDKQSGLLVYDLNGNIVHYVKIGEINNVDLRDGFLLGDQQVTLIVGSNRTDNTFVIYTINPATRQLEPIGARPVPVGLEDAYGLCLYHNQTRDSFYVFVTSSGNGGVEQWRLYDAGGTVDARLVRSFVVGSDTEGCVADDEHGYLYLGEETRGIWRYSAGPEDGDVRTLVDSTGEDGHLTPDVEGLAIYRLPDGKGYLVASSQGSDSFAVYDRTGDNAYLGSFRIVGSKGIDAVSVTDGLDVTHVSLDERFPQGMLVVQDHHNTMPDANQNFKLVSWHDIARVLNLKGATSLPAAK